MKKKVFLMAMIFCLTCFVMTACSSSSTPSAKMAVAEAAAGIENEYGAVEDVAAADSATYNEEAGLSSEQTAAVPSSGSRKLIRTVHIESETTEFDTLLSQVTKKVEMLGGYVEKSEIYGKRITDKDFASAKSAQLTVRIPGDRLGQLITEVEDSSNVVMKSEDTSDVTLQYADVESRKKSLEIEQERVWALLEKADNLDMILSLESRLTEIRYNLENMESQLRLYDNQVSYSTVHLSIREVVELSQEQPPSKTSVDRMKRGFKDNLKNVGNGVTNLLVAFVANLPYIILLTVTALIVASIAKVTHRRKNKGNTERTDALPHNKEQKFPKE